MVKVKVEKKLSKGTKLNKQKTKTLKEKEKNMDITLSNEIT